MPRVLVAGVGNAFHGDDGFGVEVVRRLALRRLPPWVRLQDVGIRGLHLAFDLLEHAYEMALIVDAAPRGGVPGTLYVIEPHLPADPASADGTGASPHGMSVEGAFRLLTRLGGTPDRVLVVGCEPADVGERMGLSPVVEAVVDDAVQLIFEWIEGTAHACGDAGTDRQAG